MSLIIKKVEAIPVALPLLKPMYMAGVVISKAYNLIVRIETQNGLTGWGEAASAPTMTGDLLPGMIAAVSDHLAPLLINQNALDHAAIMQKASNALHRNTGAKCALECALLDVCGKYLNVPVYDLIGGAKRNQFYPMHLLGSGNSDQDLADALEHQKTGTHFFKIKVGARKLEEDVAHTLRLRNELDPNTILCADANMGLTPSETITYCDATKSANLLFFEQPLHSSDLNGMSQLATRLSVPLCGDESITSIEDIAALSDAKAIKGANLKIIKLGGISAVVRAAELCQNFGLSINLACKVAESSIAAASLFHSGAVLPNLDWGISVTNQYLAEDIVQNPIKVIGGTFTLEGKPGLGVDVNEGQIRKFSLQRTF
jgi:L-alanine-DL-glutamate epimerase-like enolase superfamily enzyme